MMLLSTVSEGASTKFIIVYENKTLGTEKLAKGLSLTATYISKAVLEVISPFKYLV
jgi:hypothetical protein